MDCFYTIRISRNKLYEGFFAVCTSLWLFKIFCSSDKQKFFCLSELQKILQLPDSNFWKPLFICPVNMSARFGNTSLDASTWTDVTTSVSKTSSDMKLMLFERKNQLSDPQSNRLWANSVVCSKNSAVLVLLVT